MAELGTEKRNRGDWSSIHWLTPQWIAMAGVWPGLKQEIPKFHPGLPPDHLELLSQEQQQ